MSGPAIATANAPRPRTLAVIGAGVVGLCVALQGNAAASRSP